MKKIVFSSIAVLFVVLLYGQPKSKIVCRIWKPASFCDCPDSVNLPGIFDLTEAYEASVPCKTLDDNLFLQAVWITFPRTLGSKINLIDKFMNISLVSKKIGETLHPMAVLLPNLHTDENAAKCMYLSAATRSKKYLLRYTSKKKCDLILIFLNAAIGDKIIIDDLLQAEITK